MIYIIYSEVNIPSIDLKIVKGIIIVGSFFLSNTLLVKLNLVTELPELFELHSRTEHTHLARYEITPLLDCFLGSLY